MPGRSGWKHWWLGRLKHKLWSGKFVGMLSSKTGCKWQAETHITVLTKTLEALTVPFQYLQKLIQFCPTGGTTVPTILFCDCLEIYVFY